MILFAHKSHTRLGWPELLGSGSILGLWSGLSTRARLIGIGVTLLLLVIFGVGCSRRRFTSSYSRGQLASQCGWVEGQTSRTSLETGITSDTKPVSDTTLLDENGSVGHILTNRVLLTVGHIVGPITGVDDIVVEK